MKYYIVLIWSNKHGQWPYRCCISWYIHSLTISVKIAIHPLNHHYSSLLTIVNHHYQPSLNHSQPFFTNITTPTIITTHGNHLLFRITINHQVNWSKTWTMACYTAINHHKLQVGPAGLQSALWWSVMAMSSIWRKFRATEAAASTEGLLQKMWKKRFIGDQNDFEWFVMICNDF